MSAEMSCYFYKGYFSKQWPEMKSSTLQNLNLFVSKASSGLFGCVKYYW